MSISNFSDYLVPVIIISVFSIGMFTKTDIFDSFCKGAKEGLQTSLDILPSLILLMTCVGCLKASGVLETLSNVLTPITDLFGFPDECTPLIFIRTLSGSGALSLFDKLNADYGPDSYIGRVAATMMGSTETTFYTLAVYFGAVKIKKTRYALPAALSADLTGWIAAVLAVRMFFG